MGALFIGLVKACNCIPVGVLRIRLRLQCCPVSQFYLIFFVNFSLLIVFFCVFLLALFSCDIFLFLKFELFCFQF